MGLFLIFSWVYFWIWNPNSEAHRMKCSNDLVEVIWTLIPLQLIKPWYSAYSPSLHKVCLFTFFAPFEDKRPSGAKRETCKCEKEKVRIRETRKCRICGIIKQNRKYKSMELSADRTEEETNLWFLWFHQHD